MDHGIEIFPVEIRGILGGYIKEVERQVRKIKKEVSKLDPFWPVIVYLMPEGDTEEKLAEKRKWLAQRCIDLGYFYSDRLHIIIFGDKRDA